MEIRGAGRIASAAAASLRDLALAAEAESLDDFNAQMKAAARMLLENLCFPKPPLEEGEQYKPFEKCLVELGWMAGNPSSLREDDGPWHIGDPTPQLSVDEVRDTSQKQSGNCCAHNEIAR